MFLVSCILFYSQSQVKNEEGCDGLTDSIIFSHSIINGSTMKIHEALELDFSKALRNLKCASICPIILRVSIYRSLEEV